MLADYGNMSAPTVLFVLERRVDAGLPPRTLLTALGPGFTAAASHRGMPHDPGRSHPRPGHACSAGANLLSPVAIPRKLLARGAIELAPGHYPLIVAVHAGWLISLWLFGRHQDVNGIALAGYLVLQGFRGWVFWTLGARWTTRIIVVPASR